MNNELQELLIKAQKGDEEAKQQIVENNMGLVYASIKRFRNNQAYQDLVQVGCIGLIKAINNFDFTYNVTFSTYAVPIIVGEVKRYFRDEGQVKVSRSIKENAMKLNKAKEELIRLNNKEPTVEELMKATGLDIMDITLALESSQYCASLDATIDQKDGSSLRIDEKIEDTSIKDIEMSLSLRSEILKLDKRDQLILYYRYEKDFNQSQIAKILNLSQVQVSRLEKKIYQKLKEKLED